MAKASFQWRSLLQRIQETPFSELNIDELRTLFTQQRGMGGWLLVTAGTVALLYWNGRLVLATGVGIGVMVLVYLLHDWKVELPWTAIRRFLHGWHQPLLLSVSAGGVAALTTYTAVSIWLESESHWVAAGSLLQGMGTLAVLILLVWQGVSRQVERDRISYHQALADLTHDNPLRRLIGLRQLTNTLPDLHGNPERQRELVDYLRLMLNREEDPIVREAVLDGLQRLDRLKLLKASTQPSVHFSTPSAAQKNDRQHSPSRRHR